MGTDGYLPGALVLAHALKMQSSYDCVCLVTKDISQKARNALSQIYDSVIQINQAKHKNTISHGRQDRNILMTRFEALKLGKDSGIADYDKIILLDADVLPVYGYDELFSLPTPAGIIMEQKHECYSNASALTALWSWHELYQPSCPHGASIPSKITDRVRYDPTNMGVNAGLWILSPSLQEYNAVQASLQQPDIAALTRNFPWPEMQLATLLWSGRWTNIDIRYCSIGGYPRIDALHGMHFAGLKPWQIRNPSVLHYARFPDFVLWRQYFASLYWQYPTLREYPALQRLWDFCK